MILGIGIDIVHISRMMEWRNKPGLLERFFHHTEIDDAKERGPSQIQSLAARFAAKEAYGKALGTGMRNLKLTDVRIQTDDNGKPSLSVQGGAKNLLQKIGGKNIFVSLTHESDNAIAVVVIEGE